MIFSSYTYIVFLLIAFVVHWSLPHWLRNAFLVIASYVFYCSWEWRFGFLLLAVSLFTWIYGGFLAKRLGSRGWLPLGICVELLPLVYFKYGTFLVENVNGLAGLAGADTHLRWPSVVLPLGISFFTFQGIAYLVDIASGAQPFRNMADFVLYKAFWPQLVAGPIVRPDEIREQIERDRNIAYADVSAGAKRILHGLFKKAVLADTLAPYIDSVFAPHAAPGFLDAAVGSIGFGLQIYFDFSGYSDIAIGSAMLFGFRFPENFDLPYSSRSWNEFWSRWHMTLSRWIRDYVFTPIMFASRRHPNFAGVWLLVAMTLCGFWHGARWTFVAWGALHGLFLIANHTFLKRFFSGLDANSSGRSGVRGLAAWGLVFTGTTMAWILFRSQTLQQAKTIFIALLTFKGGLHPAILRENAVLLIVSVFIALISYQSFSRLARPIGRSLIENRWARRPVLGAYYAAIVFATVVLETSSRAFVYFQF